MTANERSERFRRALEDLERKHAHKPEPPPVCNLLQAISGYLLLLVALASPWWARWIWGG